MQNIYVSWQQLRFNLFTAVFYFLGLLAKLVYFCFYIVTCSDGDDLRTTLTNWNGQLKDTWNTFYIQH